MFKKINKSVNIMYDGFFKLLNITMSLGEYIGEYWESECLIMSLHGSHSSHMKDIKH